MMLPFDYVIVEYMKQPLWTTSLWISRTAREFH